MSRLIPGPSAAWELDEAFVASVSEVAAVVDKSVLQFQAVVKSPDTFRLAIEDSASREPRYFEVSRPFALVGRSRKCDIRLKGEDVADCHAYLQFIDGRLLWVELCAHDGSNGVQHKTLSGWLTPNTSLRVGTHTVRLVDDRYTGAEHASDLATGFNPLREYGGETGPLPRVAVEFLNGSTDRPVWTLGRVLTLVGNSPVCKVCLDSSSVSATHCGLLLTPGGLWVIDLLGRGGTAVNRQLNRYCKLEDGDRLRVGRVQMRIWYESVKRKRRNEKLIDAVVSSGVLSRDEIDHFLAELSGAESTRTELTKKLIDGGLLTPWQAQQVISSRRRRPLVLEDRYELLEPLGRGGMAKLYRALDRDLGKDVAVKFPHSDTWSRTKLTDRFRREVLLSRKLDHPNIARTLDVAKDGSFFVMEYIGKENLRQRVRRSGPLEPAEAVGFVEQVTEAVILAYRRGILHRDIKPSNIMITPNRTAKLLDFGLATHDREIGSTHDAAAEEPAQVPTSSNRVGTARYMPPELMDPTHPVDATSDIYSLGCTLFELIVGRSPFEASNKVEMMLKHAREPIPEISNADPHLRAVLNKALAKDPKQRYQTPMEFLAALQEWSGRKGPQSDARTHGPTAEPGNAKPSDAGSRLSDDEFSAQQIELRKRQEQLEAERKQLDDDQRMLSERREEFERQCATFYEQDVSSQSAQLESERSVLESRAEDLDHLGRQLEDKHAVFISLQQELEQRTQDLTAFEDDLKSMRSSLDAERIELAKSSQQQQTEKQRLHKEVTEAHAQREIHDQELLQSREEWESRLKRDEGDIHASRESLRANQSDLQAERDQFEREKTQILESEHRRFEDDQNALQQDRARLTTAQQELDVLAATLERAQHHLDEERVEVLQRAADVDHQLADVQQQREGVESQVSALKTSQEQLQEDRRECDESQRELEDDREALKDQQDRAREHGVRLKSETDTLERAKANIRKTQDDLHNEHRALKAVAGTLDKGKAELTDQRAQLQSEIAALGVERTDFENERQRMQDQHSQSVADHKALVIREETRLAELQKQCDEQRLTFQTERTEFVSELSELCEKHLKRLSGSQPR